MSYCEKSVYVKEALYANPHKYSEDEKDQMREHLSKCPECRQVATELEMSGWEG